MLHIDRIKELLYLFVELKDMDDTGIARALNDAGLELEYAERVSAFFPSAFCRIAICHKYQIDFPDTYRVEWSDSEFEYKNEEVYKLAIELGATIYHNEPELAEIFNSIVTRSAEYNTVSRALAAGSDINGAKLSPTLYFGYDTLG